MSRSIVPHATVSLVTACLVATAAAVLPLASEARSSPTRPSEPVVVAGGRLEVLAGTPVDRVWVGALHGERWVELVFQVDERDAEGVFVAAEDGVVDANDELVFLADRLGERWSSGPWPSRISQSHPALAIAVTDPLGDGAPRYAYAFTARNPLPDRADPPVRFDADAAVIRTAAYGLGVGHVGDGTLSWHSLYLFSGTADLLDGVKSRMMVANVDFPPPPPRPPGTASSGVCTGTEGGAEVLGDAGAPVIAGPARVGFDRAGSVVAYPGRARLRPLAGWHMGGPNTRLRQLHYAIDLSHAAVTGFYRDANVPAAVPIDGRADRVPAAPWPRWRELVVPDGRVVFLSTSSRMCPSDHPVGFVYRDTLDGGPHDTGDGHAFAEHGFAFGVGPGSDGLRVAREVDFPGEMIVLPHGSPIGADDLVRQQANPLRVSVSRVDPDARRAAADAPVRPGVASVRVFGRVTSAAVPYRPIAGARVTVDACPGRCEGPSSTDADGRFEVVCPAVGLAGTVAIDVRASGFAPHTGRHAFRPGDDRWRHGLEIRLERSDRPRNLDHAVALPAVWRSAPARR